MKGLFSKKGKTEGADKERTKSVKTIFNQFVTTKRQAMENGSPSEMKSSTEGELKCQHCSMPINILDLNQANFEIPPKVEEQPARTSIVKIEKLVDEKHAESPASSSVAAPSPAARRASKRQSTAPQTPQEFLSFDEKIVERIIIFAADSPKTLCALALLNSLYSELADKDIFWKPLYIRVAKEKGKQEEEQLGAITYKALYASLFKPVEPLSPKTEHSSVSSPRQEIEELPAFTPEVPVEQVIDLQKEVVVTPAATTPAKKIKSEKVEPIDPKPFYAKDYSIYDYQEEPESNIVWSEEEGKQQIDSATLNKLIEELTSHKSYDNHFLHTFMLTFRSFSDRDKLMSKLEERYNIPPPKNCSFEEFAIFKKEKLDKVRLRVCQTIKYWIEKFYLYDYDEEMIKRIEAFIEMMDKSNGSALSSMLRRTLQNAQDTSKGVVAAKLECPPSLFPKKNAFSLKKKKYGIMDWPLLEVARQITLIDYSLFKKIEPKECLNQAWAKGQRETKAPNICAMINWFNKLSNWVGTQIVQVEDIEKRTKLMGDFIQIAYHCKELNNFNGLFCIISGLALAAIYRLKQTWAALPPEQQALHKDLGQYISSERNFRFIRTAIKSVSPPCIPYIGLYLTDLTFIEEGNPKYIGDKINFVKCRKFAEVIRDMQTYQNTRYALNEVPELKDMLHNITILSESDQYNESLKREGRAQRKPTNTAAPSTAKQGA